MLTRYRPINLALSAVIINYAHTCRVTRFTEGVIPSQNTFIAWAACVKVGG